MFGRKSPLAANIALSFVRQNAEKGGRQARPKKKNHPRAKEPQVDINLNRLLYLLQASKPRRRRKGPARQHSLESRWATE